MHVHDPKAAVTSLSWGGQRFDPDERGVFDVPEEAIPHLVAHGLVAGDPPAAEPEDIAVPIPRWKNEALLAKAAELGLELAPDIKRPDLIQAVTTALKPKIEA